jgi:hypothetical protein
MNPLLVTPTDAQRRFLEVIWQTYSSRDDWPIYQYVDGTLDAEGIDAQSVLLSCPTLQSHLGPGRYGWTWHVGNPGVPGDDVKIGLTVIGMHWVAAAAAEVYRFITALGHLVSAARSFTPSPSAVQIVKVGSDQLRPMMFPMTGLDFRHLGEILRHEPPTWDCVSQRDDPDDWTATPRSRIRSYRGVEDVPEYADRVESEISPPRPEPIAARLSSLAIPEALDYLNAIWRLHAKESLFRISRAEAAARLTFECATAEEFDSQLSALSMILDSLRLPGAPVSGKLNDLKSYLAGQLPAIAANAVNAAIDDLRNVPDIRATRLHSGPTRGITAMRRLGGDLLSGDWEGQWRTIQVRVVAALNTLRNEVDQLEKPLADWQPGEPSSA